MIQSGQSGKPLKDMDATSEPIWRLVQPGGLFAKRTRVQQGSHLQAKDSKMKKLADSGTPLHRAYRIQYRMCNEILHSRVFLLTHIRVSTFLLPKHFRLVLEEILKFQHVFDEMPDFRDSRFGFQLESMVDQSIRPLRFFIGFPIIAHFAHRSSIGYHIGLFRGPQT